MDTSEVSFYIRQNIRIPADENINKLQQTPVQLPEILLSCQT